MGGEQQEDKPHPQTYQHNVVVLSIGYMASKHSLDTDVKYPYIKR